jgi:hypothetical protein
MTNDFNAHSDSCALQPGRPLAYAELKAGGVGQPAQVIYELALAGHPIEYGAGAVRLAGTPRPAARD